MLFIWWHATSHGVVDHGTYLGWPHTPHDLPYGARPRPRSSHADRRAGHLTTPSHVIALFGPTTGRTSLKGRFPRTPNSHARGRAMSSGDVVQVPKKAVLQPPTPDKPFLNENGTSSDERRASTAETPPRPRVPRCRSKWRLSACRISVVVGKRREEHAVSWTGGPKTTGLRTVFRSSSLIYPDATLDPPFSRGRTRIGGPDLRSQSRFGSGPTVGRRGRARVCGTLFGSWTSSAHRTVHSALTGAKLLL